MGRPVLSALRRRRPETLSRALQQLVLFPATAMVPPQLCRLRPSCVGTAPGIAGAKSHQRSSDSRVTPGSEHDTDPASQPQASQPQASHPQHLQAVQMSSRHGQHPSSRTPRPHRSNVTYSCNTPASGTAKTEPLPGAVDRSRCRVSQRVRQAKGRSRDGPQARGQPRSRWRQVAASDPEVLDSYPPVTTPTGATLTPTSSATSHLVGAVRRRSATASTTWH